MDFKEIDIEGEETLAALAKADHFNAYMYDVISSYCKGSILEIGSGIGNISRFFVREGANITLSDIRKQYTDRLRIDFPNKEILLMDIVDAEFENKFERYFETYDTVYALNVVEHIEDDALAIMNMTKLLKPGGNLVVLVPAYQWLYNNFDRELFHFRRYTKESLQRIMSQENLKQLDSFYFNAFGIFGWLIVGSIMKKKVIPQGNMKLYNRLMPFVRFMDGLLFNRVGLSVVTVYQKRHYPKKCVNRFSIG